MYLEKLIIPEQKFTLNFKLYFWLKYLVKVKLTQQQIATLLILIKTHQHDLEALFTSFEVFIDEKLRVNKAELFLTLISKIENTLEVEVFLFGLRLYLIKDLLLAEAKISRFAKEYTGSTPELLSVSYDNISVDKPYATRVHGALLSLVFFDRLEKGQTNFMSADAQTFMQELSKDAISLKKQGLEPNQIFMLMFSESINQSITSESGSNYEDRIAQVLRKIGVVDFKKVHDDKDKSTEFDFFFELEGRTFGIGAKRTLRERYKQFIKTAMTSNIDVMIEITLGLDLTPEKAKTIVAHGTKIFVADEIYLSRHFLQQIEGVFSVKDLTLETLKTL